MIHEEEFQKMMDKQPLYMMEYREELQNTFLAALAIGRKQGIESLGHCTCTMAQKLTGDGCSVCNPTLKREIECYNEGYKEGLTDGITEAAEVARNGDGKIMYVDGKYVAAQILSLKG